MLIDDKSVVTLSYQLFQLGPKGEDKPGLVEERSVDDPVEFLYGTGALLPSVEERIKGQSSGFQIAVTLVPEQAFGPYQESLAQWYEKSKLPKDVEIQVGMKFQTQGPSGDVIAVMVRDIQDEKVLLDGNHPLAGLYLQFEIKVLRVRAATEEELRDQSVQKVYH